MKVFINSIFLLMSICLISIGYQAYGQTDTPKDYYLKTSQLKANVDILGTGVSYEKRIGNGLTAYFDGGLTFGFNYSKGVFAGLWSDNKRHFSYILAPIVTGSLRKYYNLQKRVDKNKSIRNNSGNYVNLRLGYRFSPIAYKDMLARDAYGIEPTWGITRNLGEKLNFEVATGISFVYDPLFKEWNSGLALDIRLGYVIF